MKITLQRHIHMAVEAFRDKAIPWRVQKPSVRIDASRNVGNRSIVAFAPLHVHGNAAHESYQRDAVYQRKLNRAILKGGCTEKNCLVCAKRLLFLVQSLH